MLKFEHSLSTLLVAGIDEAGRGALAGPVVAAAVILPLDQPDILAQLSEVNDSKQLTAKKRERLYQLIVTHVLSYGIGSTPASVIDEIGIIAANVLAMQEAVAQLSPQPEHLLIDGRMRLRRLNIPQQSIIRGDSQSLSIAAASILAKVTRDRHMIQLEEQYPQYQFAKHKGYCTRAHEKAVATYGPLPIHRHTFAPIKKPMV